MQDWIRVAWQVFNFSTNFILWNSFLAFIPLFLSIWLFRQSRSRSLLWWLVLCVFIAFLPNAPYILTDIIHFISYIRQGYSTSIIILVLIPQYTLFLSLGFQAYVISLINLEVYFEKQWLKKYIFPVTLTLHWLSAIGIYLGRFLRLNSWDIIAQPNDVLRSFDNLLHKQPLILTVLSFLIIWVLYELLKRINLTLFPNLGRQKIKRKVKS